MGSTSYNTYSRNTWTIICILYIYVQCSVADIKNTKYISLDSGATENVEYVFKFVDSHRYKRDAPYNISNDTKIPPSSASNTTAALVNVTKPHDATTVNSTQSTNSTSKPKVDDRPLLGVNGSGIRKDITTQSTPVTTPNIDDDAFNETAIFKETPEMIKNEHNLTNLKYDNHTFYNSTFIDDPDYFKQYWANLSNSKAEIHGVLSNSHRRATTLKLSFDFLFYGHPIRNISVATGGFIYVGDHVHNWLAATQYIAPLMANFDTRRTNESYIKMYDGDDRFTVFWENVTLQESDKETFTFAVTLMKNGDIIFAYKNIPISIQNIDDKEHPVKVGISDAYLSDKILFYVRRKTIYEYHRVSFVKYAIKSGTILKLTALPTCLQYDTCDSCINHNTAFNCSWCSQIQRCSSGMDRNKQDWAMRNCDQLQIVNISGCKANNKTKLPINQTTSYTIDNTSSAPPFHDTVVETGHSNTANTSAISKKENATNMEILGGAARSGVIEETISIRNDSSHIGGLIAAVFTLSIVCLLAIWIIYAFKNPHTASGQLLIKYRPSQWSWKRGEARYTAATIHM